jgi:hypothetical protein
MQKKFAARIISGTVLERIIATFILLTTNIKQIFLGTADASGFKPTHASQYYTERAELRMGWMGKAVHRRRDAQAGHLSVQSRSGELLSDMIIIM